MTVRIVQETIVRFDEETGGMEYYNRFSESKKDFTTTDVFRLAMLQADMEEGDVLVKTVIKFPNIKKDATRADVIKAFVPVVAWLNAAPVMMAYANKGDGFVVIRIQRANGDFRKWGEFRQFTFDGMEQKANKRQGMFGTQTYTFGNKPIRFVTDGDYHAPSKDYWTVRVVDTPEWLELAVDGVWFMRESVRDELVNDALARQDDEYRREHLQKTLMATRKYNARFIMPGQTAKGDAVACTELNTDFVIHDCNLFTFIQSTSDQGFITLTPQDQLGDIRTNRQSIAHFWDLLFSVPTPGKKDTVGLVKDEFKRVMNEQAKLLKTGRPLSHILPGARTKDDAIRTVQVKVMKVYDLHGDLNEFPYLVAAQAAQFRDMHTPKEKREEEKKRTRLPIPAWAGTRTSISSEFTYAMVYGVKLDMEPGMCLLDEELGLVVNDHDWDLLLEVLGGADQDDHVEIHARRVIKPEVWMGRQFNAGDVVFFLVRSPIGLSSDGDHLYSEYFILTPNEASADWFLSKNNGVLADIDLTPEHEGGALPLCTAEMDDELRRSGRQPTKRDLPEEYSVPGEGKSFFMDTVYGLAENALVYDTHSAIYRKHRILGIPFEFKASEDFFIDVAAQFMNPEDLEFIRKDNDEARMRLPNPMPHTIMDELVAFHKAEVERWMRQARMHLEDLVKMQNNLHSDHQNRGLLHNGEPIYLHWVKQAEEAYRARNGGKKLSSRDFDAIGDNLAAGITRMMESDNPKWERITGESVYLSLLDARAHELGISQKSTRPGATIETMFTPLDGKLMRGQMVDFVLAAMNMEQPSNDDDLLF